MENITDLASNVTMPDGDSLTYKHFVTYDIGKAITRYWFPIMGPIGVVGNVISLISLLC